mgnify:CR=1 FL=1
MTFKMMCLASSLLEVTSPATGDTRNMKTDYYERINIPYNTGLL